MADGNGRELVKAVGNLGNALVALAQAVDANAMISEQDAVKFNGYFAAFEKNMAEVEGSMRKVDNG
jgi:hypothetical protein